MNEIKPNLGEPIKTNMEEFLGKRSNKNHFEGLPEGLFFENELKEFEYYPDFTIDVYKYLFADSDAFVLETAPAMYSFFQLAAVKVRMKEKKLERLLKTWELTNVKNSNKRVSEQKGEIRRTDKYKATVDALYRITEIRKRCDVMAKTMEKKFESVRTKSANTRIEMQPGMWEHRG